MMSEETIHWFHAEVIVAAERASPQSSDGGPSLSSQSTSVQPIERFFLDDFFPMMRAPQAAASRAWLGRKARLQESAAGCRFACLGGKAKQKYAN